MPELTDAVGGTTSRPPPRRRLWRALVVLAVVLVAVATVLIGVLAVHPQCMLGPAVGTMALFTPLAIANTPYDGSSSLNLSGQGPTYNFTSGSLTVSSQPLGGSPYLDYSDNQSGSSPWGWYYEVNWTVNSVRNFTALSESSGACTQPYVARAESVAQVNGGFLSIHHFNLTLPDPSTDQDEPQTLPVSPSVLFLNGLDPELRNSTYYSTYLNCEVPNEYLINPFQPLRVPIEIPVAGTSGTGASSGFLSWSGAMGSGPPISYTFPALGGIWTGASVGAPFPNPPPASSPPYGLLSFSYLSCP